jgi:two-component system NarL family sensor kinase
MLSMIGQKNGRLYDLLRHRDILQHGQQEKSIPQRPRVSVLAELERERARIARELHAGAGQPLAGIKLNLEMLDECARDLPPAGREALGRLQSLAEQALDQVRAVSHGLHPPQWQGLTTADAVRYLVQSSGIAARLDVEIDIQPLPFEPSHVVKVALYRCGQECLSNVLRHSGATHLSLSLKATGPAVELRIEDNGRGFPEHAPGGKGIGLIAIREHTESVGGSCDILNDPLGVTVVVSVPFEAD